ncbi:PAS domain-containing protein [Streptomyces tendae]|uniref:PAS domain-containing protein n=1 Tax=Streptomyces tendae TaxID=1932 RepID=UPI003EB7BCB5
MGSERALDVRLFDETVAAIALFEGSEHRLVYQNDACARLLGARPVGLPAREAFPEADAEEFLTVLDEVVATGRPRRLPEAREPDAGAPEQARYFVYSCTPVTMAEGRGAMVVALDTTAETMALERYEAVVTAVSQMVWVLRADGPHRSSSPAGSSSPGARGTTGWTSGGVPTSIPETGLASGGSGVPPSPRNPRGCSRPRSG